MTVKQLGNFLKSIHSTKQLITVGNYKHTKHSKTKKRKDRVPNTNNKVL